MQGQADHKQSTMRPWKVTSFLTQLSLSPWREVVVTISQAREWRLSSNNLACKWRWGGDSDNRAPGPAVRLPKGTRYPNKTGSCRQHGQAKEASPNPPGTPRPLNPTQTWSQGLH